MIETRTETSVVAVKSTFDMATIADVLTADSDSAGDRILALDEYHTDYSMTRDCSVIFAGSKIHRYSCKDPWKYTEQKELEGSFDHRKATLPFYETWVIGQVHDATSFSKYRIFDSNVGCFLVCRALLIRILRRKHATAMLCL
jgi:hypothetical protein